MVNLANSVLYAYVPCPVSSSLLLASPWRVERDDRTLAAAAAPAAAALMAT